jgi:hypothetical protein
MDKIGFKKSLEEDTNIISKVKAVNSRISKALMVEKEFSVDLDIVVRNELLMNRLLRAINASFDTHAVKGNAVRKYYEFINGKRFSYSNLLKRTI